MKTRLNLIIVLVIAFIAAFSCFGVLIYDFHPNSPRTVHDATDDLIPNLTKRVAFVERYVPFRRTYKQISYRINYFSTDHDWGVPAPSEWNIRIIAEVPADELQLWRAGLVPANVPKRNWVNDVKTMIPTNNLTEWYVDRLNPDGTVRGRGITVGIDPVHNIVVYQNFIW